MDIGSERATAIFKGRTQFDRFWRGLNRKYCIPAFEPAEESY